MKETREIQFVPIISEQIIEETTKEKPFLDQRDMTIFAQIIVSSLISYMLIGKGILDGTYIQLFCEIAFMLFVFTLLQHKISKWLVRWAKRKAIQKRMTNQKILHKHNNETNKKNQDKGRAGV